MSAFTSFEFDTKQQRVKERDRRERLKRERAAREREAKEEEALQAAIRRRLSEGDLRERVVSRVLELLKTEEVEAQVVAAAAQASAPAPKTKKKGGGMKLGKKGKKEDDFEAKLAAEGQSVGSFGAGADEEEPASSGGNSGGGGGGGGRRSTGAAAEPEVEQGPVHLKIEEKITLEANRDGGLENMEVKGIVFASVNDPAFSRIKIQTSTAGDKSVNFQTHPNVDKKKFNADASITLKSNRPYPEGSEVGVLKWRFQTNDEDAIPLTINCWPNVNSDGTADVNIDYELLDTSLTLTDVTIIIPMPGSPTIHNVDGDYDYDKRDGILEWTVGKIDGDNAEGNIELSVSSSSNDEFFPVSVNFSSPGTYAGLIIDGVETVDGAAVDYTSEVNFLVDSYEYV